MPGSTAWLIASPISDQPRSTRKQESSAIGSATSAEIAKARCMKSNWKGSSELSSSQRPRPRRRAASIPCFGAKTKAARKTQRLQHDDEPPVAPSRK